jgi:RNA polymerase sigma-32 factor
MPKRVATPRLTRKQQELVTKNVKFVFKIIASFKRWGHQDDLVAEGYLGLCMAAAKFDPKRGVKFTTYSVHWIRAMVFNYLLRTHGQMHILSGDRPLFFALLKTQSELKESPEEAVADLTALAAHYGVTVEATRVLQTRVANRDFMLDAPSLYEGGAAREMVDRTPVPEERYAQAEEQAYLEGYVGEALDRLDPRERRIVRSRDMAMADERQTLEQLAQQFGGLSRERVRQIEKTAKAKLRRHFVQAGLPPLLTATTANPVTTPAATAATPQERARRP